MAGRKPIPTNWKVVTGNPGKRPLNENEPVPDDFDVEMPRGMDPLAKEEWKRLAPELKKMNLLSAVDRDMFEAYCVAMARWREAEKFIKKNGSVYIVIDAQGNKLAKRFPQAAQAQEWLKIARSLASEFGITPSSRSKIDLSQEEDEEDDEFLHGAR